MTQTDLSPPPPPTEDSSTGPFEGPEKLLELWFCPSETDVQGLESKGERKGKGRTGLRCVRKETWDDMLDEVQCKVLSVIEGDEVDAYLLRLVICCLGERGESGDKS
jgi:S-adenosylmethionine decarboxylase